MVALAPRSSATTETTPEPSALAVARRRICIVSDDLSGVADEGIKKYSVALAAALRAGHDPLLISTVGPTAIAAVRVVPTARTFIGAALRHTIRQHRPEIVIYAARGSATFFSILRAELLRRYYPTAKVVLLALQTRRHNPLQRRLIRALRPDLIGVGSRSNADYLAGLDCRVALLPSGVDLEQFRPVDAATRRRLREGHGLRPDRPLVLHVGHLEAGRNIRRLASLAAGGVCQVALVTSSSTAAQAEHELGRELRAAGVRVITTYQPQIEVLYQMADCYLFPTVSTDNAIDIPLSVLEALACDLPVVTTRYGGLPGLFGGASDPALTFCDDPDRLVATAERVAQSGLRGGRTLVEPFGWVAIAARLLAAVGSEKV